MPISILPNYMKDPNRIMKPSSISSSVLQLIQNILALRFAWPFCLPTIKNWTRLKSISSIVSSCSQIATKLIMALARFSQKARILTLMLWNTLKLRLKMIEIIIKQCARLVLFTSNKMISRAQRNTWKWLWKSIQSISLEWLRWETFYLNLKIPRRLASTSDKPSVTTHMSFRHWLVSPMHSMTWAMLRSRFSIIIEPSRSMTKSLTCSTTWVMLSTSWEMSSKRSSTIERLWWSTPRRWNASIIWETHIVTAATSRRPSSSTWRP